MNDWILIWNFRESARLVFTCTQENSQYIGSSVTPILLIIFLFFLYSVHNDNLYCERHYAENLKPRCGACDELIFDGQYTKVSFSVSFCFRLIEFEILRENEHDILPLHFAKKIVEIRNRCLWMLYFLVHTLKKIICNIFAAASRVIWDGRKFVGQIFRFFVGGTEQKNYLAI